uniref:Uncharacterized protein n=1 Tax=Chelonoidis abingdonii TaxID=106734 RepID=A0A8C0JC91_CHEAB
MKFGVGVWERVQASSGGAGSGSSSPSLSCLFIIWKRKTSFPTFQIPNDFSVWNELVQRKETFFLHRQKMLLLLKVRLSLQQSLNSST